jgi:PrtD family type I secretion system ABC transporter
MAGSQSDRPRSRRSSDLEDARSQIRYVFVLLVLFSLVINGLMLASPIYMLQVYDRVLTTGRVETLLLITIIVGAALLVFGMLDAVRSAIAARIGCWLNARLSPLLISGGVRARLVGDQAGTQPLRDLAQVQAFLSSQALNAIFDVPWSPVFLALIWLLHPLLGLFATGSVAVLILLGLLNELVTRRSIQSSTSSQLSVLQQADMTIRNAEVVRAMGMLPNLLERWKNANDATLEETQRGAGRMAGILGFTKFVRYFVQSGTLGLGAFLVIRGEATGGVMIASSILLGRAVGPIEMVMGSWRNVSMTRLAYQRLRARLEGVPPEPARTRMPEPYGYISLEKVSYAHPNTRAPVLSNVGFQLAPGEALAIIGPSASGKSTLCRILAGVLVASDGVVRLDGTDLQHWNSERLGRVLGYLPQDVELFAGSIRDNIARMGAAPDEEVVRAAQLAHAHEMIQQLPQGYETPIGDLGTRLSGGQRQRIGLARAVFGAPRVIILDEPNANLDQAGENALAATVRDLKADGAALLIVGHRPSTLAQADKVLVLKEGKVELFGHREDVIGRLRLAASAQQRAVPTKPEEEPATG